MANGDYVRSEGELTVSVELYCHFNQSIYFPFVVKLSYVQGYPYGLLQNCVVVNLRIAQNKSLVIFEAHIKVNKNSYYYSSFSFCWMVIGLILQRGDDTRWDQGLGGQLE